MKAALSIVLAGLLVLLLPVEQVVAQATQYDAVSVQQTGPNSAARLFQIPPLTESSARLWRASSDRTPLNTELADAMFMQDAPGWWSDASGVKKVGIVLGAVVVVGAIAGGINAAGENDDPDSFKSKYSVAEGAGRYALWAIPATALGVAIVYGCKYLCPSSQ